MGVVFVVALVQQIASVALVGSLGRVTLGLHLLDIGFAGDGTQFGQNHVRFYLPIGHQAGLLQEAVGEALYLWIGVCKVSRPQGNSLLLRDSLLFDAGLGSLLSLSLLGIS